MFCAGGRIRLQRKQPLKKAFCGCIIYCKILAFHGDSPDAFLDIALKNQNHVILIFRSFSVLNNVRVQRRKPLC